MSSENFEEALEEEKQAIDFGRINYIYLNITLIGSIVICSREPLLVLALAS